MCVNVPTVQCIDVARENCKDVPVENCKDVSREVCKNVPIQKCTDVAKESRSFTTSREVCEKKLEGVCKDEKISVTTYTKEIKYSQVMIESCEYEPYFE